MSDNYIETIRSAIEPGTELNDGAISRAEAHVGRKLPESLVSWLTAFGDQAGVIGGGNFFMNSLNPDEPKDGICSISHGAETLSKAGWPVNDKFLVFGSDGMGAIFAIFHGARIGEDYPVVLVDIDTSSGPYWIMSSSFTRFALTYVPYQAWWTNADDDDADDDICEMQANKLFRDHDPILNGKCIIDMYDEGYELDELLRKINEINEHMKS